MLRMITILCIGLLSLQTSAEIEKTGPIPGQYIVKLKKEARRMSYSYVKANLFKSRSSKVRKIVRSGQFLLVKTQVNRGFSRSQMRRDMEEIKQNIFVDYVEPDQTVRLVGNEQPNDPEFDKLWGLENKGKPGVDVRALNAWETTKGSKKVVVAVIDTGVAGVADLKDNLWVNEKEKNGKPGVDDDGNGFVDDIHGYDFYNNDADPTDDHGHGTHCAGTIGASGDNKKDIVGVAWNVRIMGVKFLSRSGSGTLSGAVSSIDYATKMGAHIMSNSWGGGGFSQALFDVIEQANKKNILFVAAAGNSNSDNDKRPNYPSNYDVPNVVAVAAIDKNGNKAGFSSYGKKTVDLGAPGVGILSVTPGGLKTWSGTSMATPHVSGVAALLMSAPNFISKGRSRVQADKIKDLLLKSVTPLDSMKGKTVSGGIVNAEAALDRLKRILRRSGLSFN